MKCDYCNSVNETYVKEYEHNFTRKGKEIKFLAKRRFCAKCHNLVYDNYLDNEALKKAISIYNAKYGVNKEEIISLRKRYNLSQATFAKMLGCAKKTLISYEQGKSIPNDSYLILLKMIIEEPEYMLTILSTNEDKFTPKEQEKIFKFFKTNNTNQLFNDSDANLTEYNGYTNLDSKKIYNMILFFAEDGVLKTKLVKEMFYADFLNYKNTCVSITGLEYAKINLGPVPDQYESILNKGIKDNLINCEYKIKGEYEYYNIIAKQKWDKKIFNKEELAILNKVKNKFKNYSSKEIAEYSHKEKAFLETNYFDKISYDYAFDISLN